MVIYLMAGLWVPQPGVGTGEKCGSIVWEEDNEVGYKKLATIILFDCVRRCTKSVNSQFQYGGSGADKRYLLQTLET